MNNRLKIVMVGGGSVAWVPNIIRDMLLTPSIAGAEFVLLDIDKKAAQLTQAMLTKLAREVGADGAKFVATDRRDCLKGADYVVIAISTGGLDAMAHDLSIPEKFGVYHTVGDTSGPGGWARLVRNFDVFVSLGKDIKRLAPGAVVLNYTNPMTALTDILCRVYDGPVVGLCHGLFENLELFKRLYKLDEEKELAVHYGGINHFFWITRAHAGQTDILADLQKRVQRQSMTQIMNNGYADPMGHASVREVATELFRITGVMPYLGDRHTSEFFPWYITSKQNLKKYKLIRTTIADRRRGRAQAEKYVKSMLTGDIPPNMKRRTRETAADIIDAHSQGKTFIDVGNAPNTGQISNLPQGLVVETAVRVDRNGFTPIGFGALPPVVKGFIDPYAQCLPMLVDACFAKDKQLAMQALRLDPVCAHLNGEQVLELGDRLLGAHRKFITAF